VGVDLKGKRHARLVWCESKHNCISFVELVGVRFAFRIKLSENKGIFKGLSAVNLRVIETSIREDVAKDAKNLVLLQVVVDCLDVDPETETRLVLREVVQVKFLWLVLISYDVLHHPVVTILALYFLRNQVFGLEQLIQDTVEIGIGSPPSKAHNDLLVVCKSEQRSVVDAFSVRWSLGIQVLDDVLVAWWQVLDRDRVAIFILWGHTDSKQD